MSTDGRLRELIHLALAAQPPPPPGRLLDALVVALGVCGAALWEPGLAGGMVANVRASGPGPAEPCTGSRSFDALSGAALGTGGPQRREPAAAPAPPGCLPLAAFPVPVAEATGVLTLYGAEHLDPFGCALAADLVDVLPELLTALRARRAETLRVACREELQRARPVRSPDAALPPAAAPSPAYDRVCRAVAEAMGPVSAHLVLDGADPGVGGPVRAGTGVAPAALPRIGSAGSGARGPLLGAVDGHAVLSLAVTGEGRAWGELHCLESAVGGHAFTGSDAALMRVVGEELAQHWATWEHHATIAAEIDSWRSLTVAVTSLNECLSSELEGKNPCDRAVHDAALEVVSTVLPGVSGAVVWAAESRGNGLVPARRSDADGGEPRAGRAAARAHRSGRQSVTTNRMTLRQERLDRDVRWLISTPIGVGDDRYGVIEAFGNRSHPPPFSPGVCELVADQLGLYHHLRRTMEHLREARSELEGTMRAQAEALEDLEHQLVSPLLAATSRTERVLETGRFDGRTAAQLKAVRGLCRKASRVAMSAGVFATLSRGRDPSGRLEAHSADDLLRVLISGADDAQQLSNPRRQIAFTVERESVRSLGRRLVKADRTFLEQCVGNVLDNAAKYSFEQTEVLVRGSAGRDDFVVEVRSTGLSLDRRDTERCLQRNWRGAVARGSTGEGSGIGLWIVANLMRTMGGGVRIDVEGDRTSVRLHLPYW